MKVTDEYREEGGDGEDGGENDDDDNEDDDDDDDDSVCESYSSLYISLGTILTL